MLSYTTRDQINAHRCITEVLIGHLLTEDDARWFTARADEVRISTDVPLPLPWMPPAEPVIGSDEWWETRPGGKPSFTSGAGVAKALAHPPVRLALESGDEAAV